MNFSIQQSSLYQMLQTASKAVAVRTPKQILTGILLEGKDNSITITAYDLELGIQNTVFSDDENGLQIHEPGSIVLPARIFIDIIRKMPNAMCSVTVNNNYMTSIESGQVQFHLHGIDSAEFPQLPVFQSDSQLHLKSRDLKRLIESTVFAASNSEVRPILTGILVEHRSDHLTFTATDGLRLAKANMAIDADETNDWIAILPSKSLSEIGKLLPDDEEDVYLQLTESHGLFVVGSIHFYTRLITGAYPDTSRIIPQSSRTEIKIRSNEVASAIDRAALIARDRDNHQVQLKVEGQNMTFSSSSPEIGNVSESVEANEKDGEDFYIAFNARYVLSALSIFDSDEVLIRFNGSNQPFTIQRPESQTTLQLISPVLMR